MCCGFDSSLFFVWTRLLRFGFGLYFALVKLMILRFKISFRNEAFFFYLFPFICIFNSWRVLISPVFFIEHLLCLPHRSWSVSTALCLQMHGARRGNCRMGGCIRCLVIWSGGLCLDPRWGSNGGRIRSLANLDNSTSLSSFSLSTPQVLLTIMLLSNYGLLCLAKCCGGVKWWELCSFWKKTCFITFLFFPPPPPGKQTNASSYFEVANTIWSKNTAKFVQAFIMFYTMGSCIAYPVLLGEVWILGVGGLWLWGKIIEVRELL